VSHSHVSGTTRCVEIDEHVCLRPINGGGEGVSRRNAEGELEPVPNYFAGFMIGHDRAGFADRCEGFVRISPEGDRPTWQMTGSLEGGDLTLTPSILCVLGNQSTQKCGFHGFVRDGKWVPA
jgi:hypothetical protein